RCSVLSEERRPVEVDDVTMLADDECGRHGEAGPHHVADHYAEAEAPCLLGDQQRFGEAAALVELDVEDIEAADQTLDIIEAERAFVGGDGDRAAIAFQIRLVSTPKRLLEKRYAVRA